MSAKFSWTRLDPNPDPLNGKPCKRSSHGLSLLNNGKRLILFGGEEVARTPLMVDQSTWAAEQSDDGVWSWRNINPNDTPPPRVAHAQAVYNDCVYIFGGRAGITMKERAMNYLWKLDCSGEPGTESWTLITPSEQGDAPPEARSFHKMLCVGSA